MTRPWPTRSWFASGEGPGVHEIQDLWDMILCECMFYVVLLVADRRVRKRWSWNMLWHKPDAHKTRCGGKKQRLKLCCLLSFCLILSKTIKKSNDVWIISTFAAGGFGARSSQNSICHFQNHHNYINILFNHGFWCRMTAILVCLVQVWGFSSTRTYAFVDGFFYAAEKLHRHQLLMQWCFEHKEQLEVVTGSDLQSGWR